MTVIRLLSRAWYGDVPLNLDFPTGWDVRLVEPRRVPPLSPDAIRERLTNPVGSTRLADLAAGQRRAAVIVDDITRPTPSAELLPVILDELAIAGIMPDAVTVVIASGTHGTASPEEARKKLGHQLYSKLSVVGHDCRKDLIRLGNSPRGTPIVANRRVMECDLKIGVGGIYPHLVAGFSGGSKIVPLGVCGIETARSIHAFPKANERGRSLETEMRKDIEDIASRIGLDFVVNVVVNQDRKIINLFAGHRLEAFAAGVDYAREVYSTTPVGDVDVVIADAYPFDSSLHVAALRGAFWPLMNRRGDCSTVAIAACPTGLGSHVLFPLGRSASRKRTIGSNVRRRFRRLLSSASTPPASSAAGSLMVLSSGLTPGELARAYPGAELYADWRSLLTSLRRRHPHHRIKVAVYRCAPLLLDSSVG